MTWLLRKNTLEDTKRHQPEGGTHLAEGELGRALAPPVRGHLLESSHHGPLDCILTID